MHPGLEQCWELKSAGKGVYDLDAAYHAAIHPTVKKVESLRRQPSVPPVDPEYLQQELDRDRAAEEARRGNSRLKQFEDWQRRIAGWTTGPTMVWHSVYRPSGGTRPWGMQSQGHSGSGPRPGGNQAANRPLSVQQPGYGQSNSDRGTNQQAVNQPGAQHQAASYHFGNHRPHGNPSSRVQTSNQHAGSYNPGSQHQQFNNQASNQRGGQHVTSRPSATRQPSGQASGDRNSEGYRSLVTPFLDAQAAAPAAAASGSPSGSNLSAPRTPRSQRRKRHGGRDRRRQSRSRSRAGGSRRRSGDKNSSAKGKSRERTDDPQPDSNRSTSRLVKEENDGEDAWQRMPRRAPATPANNSRTNIETPRRLEHLNLPIRSRPEQQTAVRPAGHAMVDDLRGLTSLIKEIRQEQMAMKEAHMQKEADIVAKLEQLDEKFERQQALLLSQGPVMQSIEADLCRARTRDFTYAFESVAPDDHDDNDSEADDGYTPRSGRCHEYDGPHSPDYDQESAEESDASSEDESDGAESMDSDDEPLALLAGRKRKASADEAGPGPAKRPVSKTPIPNPYLHRIAKLQVDLRDRQELFTQYWVEMSEKERHQEREANQPRKRRRRETGSKTDPVILDR